MEPLDRLEELRAAILKAEPAAKIVRDSGNVYHLRGDEDQADQALELLKAENLDEKIVTVRTPTRKLGIATKFVN